MRLNLTLSGKMVAIPSLKLQTLFLVSGLGRVEFQPGFWDAISTTRLEKLVFRWFTLRSGVDNEGLAGFLARNPVISRMTLLDVNIDVSDN
jgi:hypothetical protein